jgi:hypothetical protein
MFHEALTCDEAHASIPPADRIFEQFIGSWNLRVRWYADDEVIREMEGEWMFSRILEGRGVQDVWIVPPRRARDDAELYEFGTSVRYYEPNQRAWRSTWIGPMHDMVQTFWARRQGDRIVLTTESQNDGAMRWVFFDISPTTFRWCNYVRIGSTWKLQQDSGARGNDLCGDNLNECCNERSAGSTASS